MRALMFALSLLDRHWGRCAAWRRVWDVYVRRRSLSHVVALPASALGLRITFSMYSRGVSPPLAISFSRRAVALFGVPLDLPRVFLPTAI